MNQDDNNKKGLVKFPDLFWKDQEEKVQKVFKSTLKTKKQNNGTQLEYILYINDKPGGVRKENSTEYENLAFRATQKMKSFEEEN